MTITRRNRTKSAKAKAMGDGNNSKPKKPKKGKTSIADIGSVVAEGVSESDDVTLVHDSNPKNWISTPPTPNRTKTQTTM